MPPTIPNPATTTLSSIAGEPHSTHHGRTLTLPENIKAYGGVGDGLTDATTAAQNALTATGSGALLIPTGTFAVTFPLTVAASATPTIVMYGSFTSTPSFTLGAGAKVTIIGLGVTPTDGAKSLFSVAEDTGSGLYGRFGIESNAVEPVDLNFRKVSVNIGSTDSSQGGGVGFNWYNATGASGQAIRIFKPGSTTDVAGVWGVNGDLELAVAGLASTALQVKRIGDANPFFSINEFGKQSWGNGAASAVDTTLERSAANVLSLGSNDAIKTGAAVHASLPAASGYAAGSQFYCTSDKQPLWSDGAGWYEADGTAH